jgi:FkbM family methyltransferase
MNLRKTIKWLAHSYCPGLRGWFSYFGTKVYFPPKAWIFRLACEQGIYEAELLHMICGLSGDDSWYFDVGANVGLMSVAPLHQRPGLKVMSFEPSPNAAPYLEKTWQQSPWKERWVVKKAAVGATVGEADFSFGAAALGGYDGLRSTQRVAVAGTQKVQITTLDYEWIRLGRPHVAFVKMDIEGAELQALAGALEMLKQCRPYVIVEWYGENLKPYGLSGVELLEFAKYNDYEVVCVPTMTVVRTWPMLKATMLTTSGFMLVPMS